MTQFSYRYVPLGRTADSDPVKIEMRKLERECDQAGPYTITPSPRLAVGYRGAGTVRQGMRNEAMRQIVEGLVHAEYQDMAIQYLLARFQKSRASDTPFQ